MAQRWHQVTRWLRPLQLVIIMFLVSRVMLLFGGYMAIAAFNPPQRDSWKTPYLLDAWANWDGQWYERIVTEGYSYNGQSEQGSVAFFPLYPILMKAAMPFVNNNTTLAGLLVSNLCLLGAVIFLYQLMIFETGDRFIARRAVLYLLIAPGSFYFTAVYTESLFLLCSLAAFYAARRHWWGWAILATMLVTVTRVIGILMWAVLLWELYQAWRDDHHAWSLTEKRDSAPEHHTKSRSVTLFYLLVAASTLLIPLALGSLMLYNASEFGDPMVFSKVQAAWGRTSFFTPNLFYELRLFFLSDWSRAGFDFKSVLSIITIVGGGLMIIPIWRKWGTSYGAYTFISWLIPIVSSSIHTQSLLRFATVVFPYFMLLAVWGKREWVDRLITITFAISLGILMSEFITRVFVG